MKLRCSRCRLFKPYAWNYASVEYHTDPSHNCKIKQNTSPLLRCTPRQKERDETRPVKNNKKNKRTLDLKFPARRPLNIKALPLGQIMKQKCKFEPQSVAVHELINRDAGKRESRAVECVSAISAKQLRLWKKSEIGHTHPPSADWRTFNIIFYSARITARGERESAWPVRSFYTYYISNGRAAVSRRNIHWNL